MTSELLELSGYVDDVVRAAASSAVRRLLGVPDSVPLTWVRRPTLDGALALHVRIGDDGEPLELDLGGPGHHRWFSGRSFSAGYRRAVEGSDPMGDAQTAALLGELHRRFARVDAAGGWGAVREALARDASFAGVSDHMYRQVSPREALVRLGFRCNQRCEFCWQDRQWPEPPAEYFREWVDAIAASGRDRITFSGGEPTIHPEFTSLVKRAAAHGAWVDVQTNAVRLARDGFAEELRELGVRGVFVSFHSHIAEVSDAMTRAPGTHVRTVAGIERALAAGLHVELNCVVEARNHAHLAEHAAFIVERFVAGDRRVAKVEYSHPSNYYEREAWRARAVPLDEVRGPLRAAIACLRAVGVEVSAVGTCGFPPCVVGDVAAELRQMDRAAEEEHDAQGRRFVEPCGRCAHQPHCLGVRNEYVELFGDRGLEPLKE